MKQNVHTLHQSAGKSRTRTFGNALARAIENVQATRGQHRNYKQTELSHLSASIEP